MSYSVYFAQSDAISVTVQLGSSVVKFYAQKFSPPYFARNSQNVLVAKILQCIVVNGGLN